MSTIALADQTTGKPDELETPRLIRHILDTHHAFLHQNMPEIGKFAAKVASVHGSAHPELLELRDCYATLKAELDGHLVKEEQILFPWIIEMDDTLCRGESMRGMHCGSVSNPISMMNLEHDATAKALSRIRQLSGDYSLPEGACNSYRYLFEKLRELDADVTEHMRIESETLFPRAEDLERKLVPDSR